MDLFINQHQREVLELLAEWRLLDINSCINLSEDGVLINYEVTKKMFQRLRQKGVVDVYRDPWTKKSYNYLTNLGEKLISPDLSMNINVNTLGHDSKVTVLCQALKKYLPPITGVELEHKFKSTMMKSYAEDLIPDAKLFGHFKKSNFIIALELEIHQKDRSRLISKAQNYLKSNYYDQAFYFFPDEVLLNRYEKIFLENLGEAYNKKIFLFTAQFLFNCKGSLLTESGVALNKHQSLFELFGIERLVPD